MQNQITMTISCGNEANVEVLHCDMCTKNNGCDRENNCAVSTEIRNFINPNNTITARKDIRVVVPHQEYFDKTQDVLFAMLRKYNGWEM